MIKNSDLLRWIGTLVCAAGGSLIGMAVSEGNALWMAGALLSVAGLGVLLLTVKED